MKKNLLVYIALTFTLLFWGLSFIGSKVALKYLNQYCILFIRFFLAALLLLPLLLKRGFPKFKLKDQALLFLVSIFQPGLYFFFEINGIRKTSASEASLIIALVPIFVLIMSYFLLKEKLTLIKFLSIILSIVGVFLLIGKNIPFLNDGISKDNLEGNLYMLGAVLSTSVYMIGIRKLSQVFSTEYITFTQFFYAALFFFPFAYKHLPQINLQSLPLSAYIAMIFLTLACSIGAFFSYNYVLTKMPASKAVVWINAIPLVTVLGGYFILSEKLDKVQIFGGIIILISVYMINLTGLSFKKRTN